MNPSELAAIFNGMSTSDQMAFLSDIKPNSFFLADEMSENYNHAQAFFETISDLLLEYHLNYGTNRLEKGVYKGVEAAFTMTDDDEINGIFFNGYFMTSDDEPFKAIEWSRVEVNHA